MTTPKVQPDPKAQSDKDALVELLKTWQHGEATSVKNCSDLMHKTENPMIRLVLDIIRHDSLMHERVQQFLLDSLEKHSVGVTPEELGEIWDAVEAHIALEKGAIELAEKATKCCQGFVQRELLLYLLEDEKKHDLLLAKMEAFKRRIYLEYFPYA